ncbi:helix-turn-helix domain-containing protein [Paenibacillus sp. GYB004]|uniref:helix-turn-helix domain-containing protein n=1 Tax=Paenibacillus sp. GYB004 TaxID=2994393 RepID=UPI002F96BF15
MRKNWFYRLLFSYMPVFIAVCVTLLLITFVSVRQLSDKSAIKSNEAVVRNAVQLIEQSLRAIENAMYDTVSTDARVAAFYDGSDPSYAGAYPAALALGNLKSRMPLLHSLYLYRPEDHTVLMPTSISRLESFPDQAYIERVYNSDRRYTWGDLRPLDETTLAGKRADVVSLSKISDLRTTGLLVANIDVSSLQTLLSDSTDTSTGYLEITGADGAVIANTSGAKARAGQQERKKLVTAEMPYTGWKIEGGLLQPGIFGWVSQVLYVSVSLGVICVASGLVWMIFVTRRHYRPVESLVRQISVFSAKRSAILSPAPGKRDEFQTIGLALDSLWDQSNRLSRENEENRRFRKTFLFRRLAEGRTVAASREALREAEQLGLWADEGMASAVVVEIDRFFVNVCRNYTDPDRQLLKYALQSAAEETVRGAGFPVWTDWLGEHRLGIMIGHRGDSAAGSQAEVPLERLRSWAEASLPFTVTIGVGAAALRIEEISRSFQTASEALAYKVPLGLNRLIRFRDLPEGGRPEIVAELQRIKEISRAFRMGEPGWREEWSLLLASMQGGSLGGEQIRHLLFVLLYHVQREMIELPAELQSAWLAESGKLEDALKEGETLAEIDAALTAVFDAVGERLLQWRESRNNRNVLQEVKTYIDANYADPGLSQAMLGDEFRLHPTSISRLFKEEFGVKFVDYVNSVRIEQAMRLMEQTELPVQDIAEKVGFVHSQTFIKIFKKCTGYTPGAYRKEKTGAG